MMSALAIEAAERGLVPDALLRAGIRRLLADRLRQLGDDDAVGRSNARWIEELKQAPLAVETDAANEQHYEVDPDFFALMLGPRRKYSACLFESGSEDLQAAENAMLRLTCERAGIADGMRVLDLGCGWGSLTLFIAENFPHCEIVAVSNSRSQRNSILSRANADARLIVNTCDINAFMPEGLFDRIVSVEMFEHLRNYRLLFERLADWLADDGKVFAHVFCHQRACYPFEPKGATNWMGRWFFTGGQMPSADLFYAFQERLTIERQWSVNGFHYSRTLLAWLDRLDRNRQEALRILSRTHGQKEARRWLQRWRIFLYACAELFGYNGGEEWFVSHYLWRKRSSGKSIPAAIAASAAE